MRNLYVSTALVALTALAYDPGKTGWKTDEDGNIVTDGSGNPIMLDDGGKETSLSPGYVHRINSENVKHRTAAKEAQDKLTAYGDLDPEAARAAIEKMKDVNLDDLVNKGEIEKIKAAVVSQYEPQLKEVTDKLSAAEQRANDLLRKNAFSSSRFLNERLAVPRDMAEAAFGNNFKIEDGNLVPVRANGDIVYNSRGEVASVDEAFEIFISERPDKDKLLLAPAQSGTGSGGAGGNRGGGNVLKRADFDKLPQMEKAAIGQKVAKGEIKIVD
jgi:hypothetical protein